MPRNFSTPKTFKNEVISFVESNLKEIKSYHPNIYIYYLSELMFTTLNDKYLLEIENYYKQCSKKFNNDLQNSYFTMVVSYYMVKIYTLIGETKKYKQKLFYMYDYNFVQKSPSNAHLINGYIQGAVFFNAVDLGIKLKKYSWVRKFMEKNKGYLHPVKKNDEYNIANAILTMALRDFTKSLDYIGMVSKLTPRYFFITKSIQAKIYYEIGDYTGLNYNIENLNELIKKNKNINNDRANTLRLFNKFILKLVKLKNMNGEKLLKEKTYYKFQLDKETNYIPSKEWFYEKVKEL